MPKHRVTFTAVSPVTGVEKADEMRLFATQARRFEDVPGAGSSEDRVPGNMKEEASVVTKLDALKGMWPSQSF